MTLTTHMITQEVGRQGFTPPCRVVSAEYAGDPHTFFTMHGIVPGPTENIATVSALVRERGALVEDVYELHMPSSEPVYPTLDHWATAQICEHHASFYQDGTRRVCVTDATGPQVCYRKFGRAITMERVMSSALAVLGYATPAPRTAASEDSLWTTEAPGRLLQQWLVTFFAQHGHVDGHDLTETTLRCFREFGELAVMMWLFGHSDFHCESYLFPSPTAAATRGITLDLESTGQDAIFDRLSAEPIAFRLWRHISGAMTIPFCNLPSQFFIPRWPAVVYERLAEGMQRICTACVSTPDFVEPALAIFAQHTGPLFTRVVVTPTVNYLNRFGGGFPLPHFTARITGQQVAALVRQRRAALAEEVTQHGLTIDPHADGFPSIATTTDRFFFRVNQREPYVYGEPHREFLRD